MIAALMIYGFLVTALIATAAWSIEQAFAALKWPRRGVWMLSLIASLTLPALMASTTHIPPATRFPAESMGSVDAARTSLLSNLPISASANSSQAPQMMWPVRPNLDTFLKAAWIIGSSGALAFYAMGWIRLRHASRYWRYERIDGVTVSVADHIGPAVIGFLKPEIVVPRWLLRAQISTRQMAMAHERAHLAAGDPLLVLSALVLAAVAPWNLPLLWQVRRLRFAIEVDCDARVLRGGADASAYGEMLLAVGQNGVQLPVGAVALTEPASQLERRIRIMMSRTYRHARFFVMVSTALSASLIVAAAQIGAPTLDAAQAVAQNVSPARDDQAAAIVRRVTEQRGQFKIFPMAIPTDPKLLDKYNKALFISLTSGGSILVKLGLAPSDPGEVVPSLREFSAAVIALVPEGRASKDVYIRADFDLPYKDVMKLMNMLRDAGFTKVGIAAEQVNN